LDKQYIVFFHTHLVLDKQYIGFFHSFGQAITVKAFYFMGTKFRVLMMMDMDFQNIHTTIE